MPALRELAYRVHQFSRTAGFTGAARDVLADRLRKLEDAGIVERRRCSEQPPRYEYHLAQVGHELFPVMSASREWGDKWAVAAPPLEFRHSCGHPAVTELHGRHRQEPVSRESLTPLRADHGPERRGADAAGPREPRTEWLWDPPPTDLPRGWMCARSSRPPCRIPSADVVRMRSPRRSFRPPGLGRFPACEPPQEWSSTGRGSLRFENVSSHHVPPGLA